MATTIRHYIYDDLESIPREREGDRHEIIDGRVIVTPAPIPYHQEISGNISEPLRSFVRARRLGKVYYAPVDIRLTPDNVLIPDIVFIARDRLHIVGPKTIDAAPDLVVEILSPGTRQRDLTVKRELYARFGVQEYWIVDPETETLTVHRWTPDGYLIALRAARGETVRAEPFDAIEIAVGTFFGDE